MTDNDKAAIAAGLFKEQACVPEFLDLAGKDNVYQCPKCYQTLTGTRESLFSTAHNRFSVPDMHDPANLFRGMTNRWQDLFQMKRLWTDDRLLSVVVFAALVALYDAEHKGETDGMA